jgi:hypothetical protein
MKMSDKPGKCKIALNIIVDGKKYKVAEPTDPCYSVNKVLAKYENVELITLEQHMKMKTKISG